MKLVMALLLKVYWIDILVNNRNTRKNAEFQRFFVFYGKYFRENLSIMRVKVKDGEYYQLMEGILK